MTLYVIAVVFVKTKKVPCGVTLYVVNSFGVGAACISSRTGFDDGCTPPTILYYYILRASFTVVVLHSLCPIFTTQFKFKILVEYNV